MWRRPIIRKTSVSPVNWWTTGKTSLSKNNGQRAAELFAMALTMQNNQRLEETIETLKKVLTVLPEYNSALANLGTIYFKKGDFEEARAQFLKAIESNPENIEALTSLGLISLNDNFSLNWVLITDFKNYG